MNMPPHRRSTPVLSCVDVTKTYRNRPVIDRVTCQVRAGTVTGLLGPNGAGKTTLLKILLGLTTADSGRVSRPQPAHLGSALEIAGFRKEMTVKTVLRSAAMRLGTPQTDVPALIDQVGLPDPRQRVGTLSLGMTQRLRVAMALIGQPRILILDEPLNGLDPAGMRWLRGVIRAQANRGTAVLLSSHLLHEAECIVDELLIIDKGRVKAQGSRTALLGPGQELEDYFFALTESPTQEEALP